MITIQNVNETHYLPIICHECRLYRNGYSFAAIGAIALGLGLGLGLLQACYKTELENLFHPLIL